ncbi:hypothetical protein DENSPDRAFT_850181 [Dentipellis sp. KUC8613]|nr:hypothetical protein DENSPDRAFT_850181 [Dentipellis sp. KUC8613]
MKKVKDAPKRARAPTANNAPATSTTKTSCDSSQNPTTATGSSTTRPATTAETRETSTEPPPGRPPEKNAAKGDDNEASAWQNNQPQIKKKKEGKKKTSIGCFSESSDRPHPPRTEKGAKAPHNPTQAAQKQEVQEEHQHFAPSRHTNARTDARRNNSPDKTQKKR